MIMRYVNLLCLLVLLTNKPYAQQTQTYLPKTAIKAAYMGSIIYPGFSVTLERPYKVTEIHKTRFKKPLTLYKERYYGFSMSLYHHSDFHTNLLLQSEWIARRQYSKGFFMEGSWGLGLSRTFNAAATYEVDDNGNVNKVPIAGKFYGLTSFNVALGYHIGIKENKPLSLYLKPGAIVMFPYSSFVLPRPTLQLGVIYQLNNFWKATPIRKTKEKVKKVKTVKPKK